MKRLNDAKQTGTLWIIACYAAALAGAAGIVSTTPSQLPIWNALGTDVAATVIVFAFSLIFRNASFYDPYWSVAPVPIAIYWKYQYAPGEWNLPEVVLLVVICAWSVRLTLNWYRGWGGLHHQDWRYTDLKYKTGRFYPAINFLGIHLFPTLIVFLGCLPLIGFFDTADGPAASTFQPILFGLGVLTGFAAPAIQWIADEQMRQHRRNAHRTYIDAGLWKYSRHPNYFGEILFWVSLALMGSASPGFEWWMLSGVAAMILLFVFISIPMMEKHVLEKYPEYEKHREQVSMLIPWFRNP